MGMITKSEESRLTFYSTDELKQFLHSVPEGQLVKVIVEFEDDVLCRATGDIGDGSKEESSKSE